MIFFIVIFFTFGSILALPFEQNSNPIQNLNFTIIENNENNEFPKSFSLSVNEQGHSFEGQFEIQQNQLSPPVSVYENGKVRLVELAKFEKHQVYREKSGKGFATLIENKIKTEKKHRIFARIFPDKNKNNHYDIYHILKKHARLGYLTFEHLMHKTELDKQNFNSTINLEEIKDYKLLPEGNI